MLQKSTLDLPVSLPIRSVNLCKTPLTLWTPSGGGEPEPQNWDHKSQKCHSQNTNWVSLCLREQQQNQLDPKGVKSYGSVLFLKESTIWGADLQCEMFFQQFNRLITNCTSETFLCLRNGFSALKSFNCIPNTQLQSWNRVLSVTSCILV